MTNYKSISFSTPMMEAIIARNKTQTRRPIKELNNYLDNELLSVGPTVINGVLHFEIVLKGIDKTFLIKPQYQPGQTIYVRETFAEFLDEYIYRADNKPSEKFMTWKPSMHMPVEAARKFLHVKSVTVQRVKDITSDQAKAEGVKKIADYGENGYLDYNYPNDSYTDLDAKDSFKSLWISIYKSLAWFKNQYVFAYEFEECEAPDDWNDFVQKKIAQRKPKKVK
ncbi:hypothetical protein SAMN05216480_10512 [Pustulibacterium marinum]|uniref:Uncharacterized protein n=1 Tax=Pustulibacterium marinum TaxID=1224947 RepID=A0A1I7GJT6_9FLAO|nr:hypothetical protein [Pustulibacterium marinum]SFU48727.1 hypothetical protein SAMN05216480_10512 [Pustulibacterium marinum]